MLISLLFVVRINKDISLQSNNCNKAMQLTLDILENNLGIANSSLLPSQIPLLPIATYFYKNNITSIDKLGSKNLNNLLNWFILVSFNGFYSSQTDTKLERDLEVIRKNSEFPFAELLENVKKRKSKVKITLDDIKHGLSFNILKSQGRSYLFLLYILLVKNNADNWNGTLLKKSRFNELARHHIFPKEYLEENIAFDDP